MHSSGTLAIPPRLDLYHTDFLNEDNKKFGKFVCQGTVMQVFYADFVDVL